MPNLIEARKRSVDNLQRLYTVVVSLAITASLGRTLLNQDKVDLTWSNKWVMFLSLLVTVIPFYHGANRYLDATYVTGERSAKRYSLMLDFLFLFFQALLLFTLALSITNEPSHIDRSDTYFYLGLTLLLLVDVIWVTITRYTTKSVTDAGVISNSNYTRWAGLNIIVIVLILVLIFYHLWVFLLALAFLRSVLDYFISHDFYYPQS
jgi:uncharacterized membrane protein